MSNEPQVQVTMSKKQYDDYIENYLTVAPNVCDDKKKSLKALQSLVSQLKPGITTEINAANIISQAMNIIAFELLENTCQGKAEDPQKCDCCGGDGLLISQRILTTLLPLW